jgi:hypothetical protein
MRNDSSGGASAAVRLAEAPMTVSFFSKETTMVARITDDDLKIRHTTVHVLLAALGCIPDDSSPSTIWKVQRWVNKAVAAGRMAIDSEGHYRITREFKELMVQRNAQHTRRRRAA